MENSQGLTSRVARGSLWSLSAQGVSLVASLLATPFIIRLLGTESYGVLALINILISYLTFSEFGMGVASTRFGSEAYARHDEAREAAVVWTSLLLACVPALLISVIFVLGSQTIVEQLLRLPTSLAQIATIGLQLATIGFFCRTILGVVNTALVVRLRMDLIAKVNTAGSVLQTLGVLAVLLLGGGLIGAVAVTSVVSLLLALVFGWFSVTLLPQLKTPRIDYTLLRPLTRFGGWVVVSSLAALLLTNGEKVLLTRYGSVRALAHYSVAFALAMMLTQVPSAMSQSILPALSGLQAVQDVEPLRRLSNNALRGTLFWVVPTAMLMCVCAKPFFTIWAGPEFGDQSTVPFYVLAIGLIFNVLAWVPYNLLIAMGKTGLIARFHLIELLPYIVLTTLLSSWFGAVGAAVAWSLRVIITAPFVVIFAQRASGLRLSALPVNVVGYLMSVLLLLGPPIIAMNLWHRPAISIPIAIASLVGYGTLIWLKVLSDEERVGILRLLPWKRIAHRQGNGGNE